MRPAVFLALLVIVLPAEAQNSLKAVNPEVRRIADGVSRDRLEAIVRKLEGFRFDTYKVAKVTEYVLKDVSIDEWVIGVRAVGQNGEESLTSAYTNPVRTKSVHQTLP